MKTFFDSIYVCSSNLYGEPEYPMKLEYYRTVEKEENVEVKYGIEVVKIEFIEGKVSIENERLENVAENQEEIDRILATLRDNKVTPFGIHEILDEIFIKIKT